MHSPEAQEAANKLLGHCGDAPTQDVMNACFAMEFRNADQEMNSVFRATLKRSANQEQQRVRGAQKAWLQDRDLHYLAVGDGQAGGGSLEPTEMLSCKADLSKARTKEIEASYKPPE